MNIESEYLKLAFFLFYFDRFFFQFNLCNLCAFKIINVVNKVFVDNYYWWLIWWIEYYLSQKSDLKPAVNESTPFILRLNTFEDHSDDIECLSDIIMITENPNGKFISDESHQVLATQHLPLKMLLPILCQCVTIRNCQINCLYLWNIIPSNCFFLLRPTGCDNIYRFERKIAYIFKWSTLRYEQRPHRDQRFRRKILLYDDRCRF